MNAILTFQEATNYLNVSKYWLRRAVRNKKLKYIKVGHLVRFKKSDLDEFIEENTFRVEY